VALKHFLQKGYRFTSMDDIASDLGISKKTIYLYFPGKENLLSAAIQLYRMKLAAKVEAVLENRQLPFPVKLSTVLTRFASTSSQLGPKLFEDLRMFVPELWISLKTSINESIHLYLFNLLQQGVDQGFINPRISIRVIVMLYAAAIQSFLDGEFTGQFPETAPNLRADSSYESIDQAVRILLDGILSDKAKGDFVGG
jgi:AcrR family transcriptional regulator